MNDFNKIAAQIIGKEVRNIKLGYGSFIIIDFGNYFKKKDYYKKRRKEYIYR